MTEATQRVCVGIVTGPQGVRGAVRIKSFTEVPEDIARYGPLRDESGHQSFEVQVCGTAKGVLIARLSGVEDRDQAEALRGLRLYLPRTALPQTEAEEYYHADLIGLGVDEAELVAIEQAVAAKVERATVEAKAAPPPPISTAFTDVWADGSWAWRS